MSIWIAAIVAVLVQPLIYLVWLTPQYFDSTHPFYGLVLVLVAVLAVAGAIVLFLGIPTFLVLRKFRKDSWRSLATFGFVLGLLPFASFWPRNLEGYSAGQNWHGTFVDTYINGIPTRFAWLIFGEDLLHMAVHGLVGALVFYAIWRRLERPNTSFNPDALERAG